MLHNQGYHDCFGIEDVVSGDVIVQLDQVFPDMFKLFTETSMDGLDNGDWKNTSNSFIVKEMEIETYNLININSFLVKTP